MPSLTRREFVFLGVASGAAVAVGVVVPLSIVTRDLEEGGTATTTTTSVAGPAALVTVFPRTRIASVGSLQEAVPVEFDYPFEGQGNVLVKLGREAIGGIGPEEDIVAFSRICTHMGCSISEFHGEHGVLGPCPCHFSTFDLVHNGQVTLGQATQNLPQVLLEIDGDDLYATGVLRLLYGHHNTLEGGSA